MKGLRVHDVRLIVQDINNTICFHLFSDVVKHLVEEYLKLMEESSHIRKSLSISTTSTRLQILADNRLNKLMLRPTCLEATEAIRTTAVEMKEEYEEIEKLFSCNFNPPACYSVFLDVLPEALVNERTRERINLLCDLPPPLNIEHPTVLQQKAIKKYKALVRHRLTKNLLRADHVQ